MAPAGLKVLWGGVPGYSAGVGGGFLAVHERFVFALGVRFEYSFLQPNRINSHIYQVGPELRVGGLGRRVFGYGLLRGGYTQQVNREVQYRWHGPTPAPVERGWHLGFGGGAWARVHGRLMVGGELVFEVSMVPAATVSLVLGAFL